MYHSPKVLANAGLRAALRGLPAAFVGCVQGGIPRAMLAKKQTYRAYGKR